MIRALAALVLFGATAAWADCTTMPTLCGLPVQSTIEEPDLDEAIDVVLLGDGFTDSATWAGVAANAIATLKAQNNTGVYGAVPGLYNFHVVTVLSASTDVGNTDLADTALGMKVSGPYITADSSRVATAATNAPDVDLIIAIGNGGGRANANYATGLATGGVVRLGSDLSPISHELGHAVIHVADEYIEAANCTGPNEAGAIAERNVTADPTCAKFASTAGAGCVQGAKYCATGMYRSAGSCLMSSSGNTTPCPVCQRAIREVLLEKQTGVDHAEPWAVVTAPSSGSTLAGLTRFSALLYDDTFTPMRVSFVVDGAFRGSVLAPSTFAQLDFDTRVLADGSHTLKVFVDDAAGHAGVGTGATFTTQNFTVPGTSTLSLGNPMNNATVSGTVFISGAATDPAPAWLALVVDGVPLAMAVETKSIFSPWNATAVPPGAHVLELKGADHLGNLLAPAVANVTVTAPNPDAGGGQGGGTLGGGLSVFVSAPASFAPVGPSFLLQYSVSGASAASTPELFLDGVKVMPNPLPAIPPPTSGESGVQVALVDSAAWALGPHQLVVRVTSGAQAADSKPFAVVRVAPGAKPVALLRAPVPGASLRGTVSVVASGYDDVAVASLTLFVDGVPGPVQNGSTATFMWNTTALTEGSHTLQVRATDSASNTGDSDRIFVTVDNTPPVLGITSPTNGSTVPASLMPLVVLNDGAALLEVRVDGAVVTTAAVNNGTLAFPLTLAPGPHTLQVSGTDRAGNAAMSAVVNVTAANCTAASCNDGLACTTDSCGTSGACAHVATAGCCVTPADCGDGDACTTDTCNTGVCGHAAVAGCCNYGQACSDAMACTTDRCSGPGGTCSHGTNGCCSTPADCNDGNTCTADTCLPNGQCLNDWNGACCRSPADCDDHDVCTTETCNASGQCVSMPVAGCCNTAADCDDQVLCTQNTCSNHVCTFPPRPGCCVTGADCTTFDACETRTCGTGNNCTSVRTANCCTFGFECDDRDACTVDSCAGSTCQHQQVCCTMNAQCNDGKTCTTDSCDTTAGRCVFAPVANCCTAPADCDDGNACTTDACGGSMCSHTPIAGCCTSATQCADADVCTTDTCTNNVCAHAPTAGCCTSPAQCADADVCTTDTCTNNVCAHAATAGCCTSPAQCSDGDACTSDVCTNNVCGHAPVAGCCTGAGQCDDADACTADACTNNVCTHTNSCCTTPAQCDDSDLCTVDTCTTGMCGHARTAGCCTAVTQCDDGNACTDDACAANLCVSTPKASCCTSAAQCDDGNTCTQDVCSNGVCSHQTGCCTVDADCADTSACTTDRCSAGMCVHDEVPFCCVTAADCGAATCTTATCSNGLCSSTPVAGCCASAADCATGQACVNQACVAEQMPPPPPGQVTGTCGCGTGDGLAAFGLCAFAGLLRRRRRAEAND